MRKEMGVSGIVEIDWDGVIKQFRFLDCKENYDSESEEPFQGAIIARLLGEYGLVARKAVFPPEETHLSVVVWPPSVWFCPSQDGLDGVFVEPYKEAKHGSGIEFVKSENIWDFTNLDATRDAWKFHSQMIWSQAK